MIGSLRGTLIDRSTEGEVLIEVSGVGYRVVVTPSTFVGLGDVGSEVFVHIHHHVREVSQTLYGFVTAGDRRCFEALLGAHGVGPALALAILGVHSPAALRQVMAEDDVASLCLVPGVGRKTAARLLIDLKASLELAVADIVALAGGGASPAQAPASSARSDVREALVGLGYGPEEVREVLRDLPTEGDASLLLRDALQRLAVVRSHA